MLSFVTKSCDPSLAKKCDPVILYSLNNIKLKFRALHEGISTNKLYISEYYFATSPLPTLFTLFGHFGALKAMRH